MARKRDGFTNNIGTILNDTVDQVVCDAFDQNYAHKTTKKLLYYLIERCNLGQEEDEDSSDSKYVPSSNSESDDSSISTCPGSVSGTSIATADNVTANITTVDVATADVATVDVATVDFAAINVATVDVAAVDVAAVDVATVDIVIADVTTVNVTDVDFVTRDVLIADVTTVNVTDVDFVTADVATIDVVTLDVATKHTITKEEKEVLFQKFHPHVTTMDQAVAYYIGHAMARWAESGKEIDHQSL